jgi:hypothetical protein
MHRCVFFEAHRGFFDDWTRQPSEGKEQGEGNEFLLKKNKKKNKKKAPIKRFQKKKKKKNSSNFPQNQKNNPASEPSIIIFS